jgi:hypothetical protein
MHLVTSGTLPNLTSPYKVEESPGSSLCQKLHGARFAHRKLGRLKDMRFYVSQPYRP